MGDDFTGDTTPKTTSTKPPGNVSEAADHEEVFYEGNPRLRGEIGTTFLWAAAGLLFIIVPIYLAAKTQSGIGWIPLLVSIAIGLLLITIPQILTRRTFYRITNYRIDFEHGMVFKKSDTLELWHVEDVSLTQGPLDRIFNVGTIKIVSADATTPILFLHSIPHPRDTFTQLKQRIIAVKRQRGVVKIDV